jgi:hypothetical protein
VNQQCCDFATLKLFKHFKNPRGTTGCEEILQNQKLLSSIRTFYWCPRNLFGKCGHLSECQSRYGDADDPDNWDIDDIAAAATKATKHIIRFCLGLTEITVCSERENLSSHGKGIVSFLPLCSLPRPNLKSVDLDVTLDAGCSFPAERHQHDDKHPLMACNNIELLRLHFESNKGPGSGKKWLPDFIEHFAMLQFLSITDSGDLQYTD